MRRQRSHSPPGWTLAAVVLQVLWAVGVGAQPWPQAPLVPKPPLVAAVVGPQGSGNATFQQYIDHANPGLGTFSQRYWWNTSHWRGPGSPIVLFTPGETTADGYQGFMTNSTLVGQYAQAIGGATILFEHRYWGESSPFEVLDTQNLTYLTLQNSVDDLVHFARTVKLTFDTSGRSNAPAAPWINVGASYSGALAAWTERLSPGTFWAYHASSGPVQAVYDYWSYFVPVEKGMPQNCSADMARIADHVDQVLDGNDADEIACLKNMFGLADVEHADDFASAVSGPLGIWQSVQLFTRYSAFYQMCDSMEGVRPVKINGTDVMWSNFTTVRNDTAPATGVGLKTALANYAKWFKYEWLPDTCSEYGYADWRDSNSVGCFDSYNTSSPYLSDVKVNNTVNRQWLWMVCNEPFFYWQTGAPNDRPSIVPRHVSAEYYQRQCGLLFPEQGNSTFGSGAGKTAEMVNSLTSGWHLTNTTRLIWVNGEFDPWRSASVSSEFRPGGPLQSTSEVPVFLMLGARHCNDMNVRSGQVNDEVGRTQEAVIKVVQEWVADFYKLKPRWGARSAKFRPRPEGWVR
ncbi:putative serine peptidase [Podospora didyma]|uniref:Serine peptidase n=1 Tax=Podospora didyma TaxID=330526 RepID=A0AAE0NG45_9PEZI|nr:putative serine peptidase [Podospora didyma]